MKTLDRKLVLKTLAQHETLLASDIAKPENIGIVPNLDGLQNVLDDLSDSGFITKLTSMELPTYTITEKGIDEVERLASSK